MGLFQPQPDNVTRITADAADNKAVYLANAQSLTERIAERREVVEARLAALEAEQRDLASISL
jgi:hypothetical protein